MKTPMVLLEAALLMVSVLILALPEARTPRMHWLAVGPYAASVIPMLRRAGVLRMTVPQVSTAYRRRNPSMPKITLLTGVATFSAIAAIRVS